MSELSEPSLWVIVLTLSGVVAAGGRWVITQLQQCQQDRDELHTKVNKVASAYAAEFGKTIEF